MGRAKKSTFDDDFATSHPSNVMCYVKIVLVAVFFVVLIGIPLLPVLAICGLTKLLGAVCVALGEFATMCMGLVATILYAMWLVLIGDWMQVATLFLEFMEWLRQA